MNTVLFVEKGAPLDSPNTIWTPLGVKTLNKKQGLYSHCERLERWTGWRHGSPLHLSLRGQGGGSRVVLRYGASDCKSLLDERSGSDDASALGNMQRLRRELTCHFLTYSVFAAFLTRSFCIPIPCVVLWT